MNKLLIASLLTLSLVGPVWAGSEKKFLAVVDSTPSEKEILLNIYAKLEEIIINQEEIICGDIGCRKMDAVHGCVCPALDDDMKVNETPISTKPL